MAGRPLIVVAALLVSTAAMLAQSAAPEAGPYCADLKRVTFFAITRDRFAPITGKPRDGSFNETTLPLTGWRDCALYGAATYTCDSHELTTPPEAEALQAKVAGEIIGCLGSHWSEEKERSSPGYLVLHPASGPLSITLSLDQTGSSGRHLVRFMLFLRRR
jgi:hypothetical protein